MTVHCTVYEKKTQNARQTKYCVFLKILINFPFPFCFAALSFLPKGIGGVFVDYSGYNKEFSEFLQSMLLSGRCLQIILTFAKKNLISRNITTSSLSYAQCRKPNKVYRRSPQQRRRLYFASFYLYLLIYGEYRSRLLLNIVIQVHTYCPWRFAGTTLLF